jgi:hypothetical protein
MRRLFYICFFLTLAFCTNAQSGYFVKYFGDTALTNVAKAVYQLPGGSIYATGSANSNVIGGRDIFLSKFDADGNVLWTYYYGTTDEESSARMIFNGSRFIICGQTNNVSATIVDGIMIAVDTLGNQQWLYRYGSPSNSESLSGLCRAVDGGIIASGFKSDSASSGNDFWLIKTDSAGIFQWEKTYGDMSRNEVSDVVLQTNNGDIFLSGDKQVTPGVYNAWLVKADSAGNYGWDLILENPHNGGCKNMFLDSMNHLVIIGEASTDSSANFDIQLCKADLNGNLIWLKYIIASNFSDAGFDIVNVAADKYMLTGYYYDTTTSSKRIPMMLVDSAGNELNRKLFGNSIANIGYSIIPSVYEGYLVCGTDIENDMGILIYDNVDEPNGIYNKEIGIEISVYPNPVSTATRIHFSKTFSHAKVLIHDSKAILVQSSLLVDSSTIDLKESLKSGIYFLNVLTSKGNYFFKLAVN